MAEPEMDEPAAAAEMAEAEAPAADEAAEPEAPPADAAAEPEILKGDQIAELLVGNTIIAEFEPWKLNWSEYFAPNGTTKVLLRFEGQDDVRNTGFHYPNPKGLYCTEYPDIEGQTVFCSMLAVLGDGRYQQFYPDDNSMGAIYHQILPGEQLDALE